MRLLTLVQCAGPAPAGGYHMSKPPILIWLNAYHLATLTLHGWRLGPSRRISLFLFYAGTTFALKPATAKDSYKYDTSASVAIGWDSWIRTSGMTESKSVALPLGYTPTFLCCFLLLITIVLFRTGPSSWDCTNINKYLLY